MYNRKCIDNIDHILLNFNNYGLWLHIILFFLNTMIVLSFSMIFKRKWVTKPTFTPAMKVSLRTEVNKGIRTTVLGNN